MELPKYSIGTGDRFGQQGKPLLKAIMKARNNGINLSIVWNKSEREHSIIKTSPKDVFIEAKNAVSEYSYDGKYFIDADHINYNNVDHYIKYSNYFTIDVAEFIGRKPPRKDMDKFIEKSKDYEENLSISDLKASLEVTNELIRQIAEKYLSAVSEAGRIYRKIEKKKGRGNFITEISMDETKDPQTPFEILFILLAIAEENIPIQTIAPKFSGQFLKGIDYVGDIDQFIREFRNDLAIINFAIEEFSFPTTLKLSIHSGSDKFSLYPQIRKAIRDFNTGVHIKTAGTTWLEELIGLAAAGGDGLETVKEIYAKAYRRFDDLCKPYASVISINRKELPSPDTVKDWSSEEIMNALIHDIDNVNLDRNLRQLFHVAYKIAAEMGEIYIKALRKHNSIISEKVTFNILERHIKKIFF